LLIGKLVIGRENWLANYPITETIFMENNNESEDIIYPDHNYQYHDIVCDAGL
jgi:hypothetical protein